jgi:ribose 5-phosphate isomerase
VDQFVTSGMAVGLGTGSTAYFAVERLGLKLAAGELADVVAVPTSERTRLQAAALGIPLATLDDLGARLLDVAIDGADSVEKYRDRLRRGRPPTTHTKASSYLPATIHSFLSFVWSLS